MPSQSEADRALREHSALQKEVGASHQSHEEVASKPLDTTQQAVNKSRDSSHPTEFPKHSEPR